MIWKLRKITYRIRLSQLLYWIWSHVQFEKKNHGLRERYPWQVHLSQRSAKDLQSSIILTSLATINLGKIAKKAQKLTKFSPSIWCYVVSVKSTVKILSIFVAFLENVNFSKNPNLNPHQGIRWYTTSVLIVNFLANSILTI